MQGLRHQVVHERLEAQLGPRHGDEATNRGRQEKTPHRAHDDAHAQRLTRVVRVDRKDTGSELEQEAVERTNDAPARVEHRHRRQHPRQEKHPDDRSGRETQTASAKHQHEHDDPEERPHQVAGAQDPPQQVHRVGRDEGPRRQVLRVLPQRPDACRWRLPPDSAAPAHALVFPSGVPRSSDEAGAASALFCAVASTSGSSAGWSGASLLLLREDR